MVDDEPEPDEIVKVKVDTTEDGGDTVIVGGLVYPLPPFISVIVSIKKLLPEPLVVKLHVAPAPPPPVIVKLVGATVYLPLVKAIDVTLPPLPPPPPPPLLLPSCWI